MLDWWLLAFGLVLLIGKSQITHPYRWGNANAAVEEALIQIRMMFAGRKEFDNPNHSISEQFRKEEWGNGTTLNKFANCCLLLCICVLFHIVMLGLSRGKESLFHHGGASPRIILAAVVGVIAPLLFAVRQWYIEGIEKGFLEGYEHGFKDGKSNRKPEDSDFWNPADHPGLDL